MRIYRYVIGILTLAGLALAQDVPTQDTAKGQADAASVAAESERTVARHATNEEAFRIGVGNGAWTTALEGLVNLGGRLVAEGLVRPHVIEVLAKAIHDPLLRNDRLSGVGLDLGAYVGVHTLVSSIVLWAAWT